MANDQCVRYIRFGCPREKRGARSRGRLASRGEVGIRSSSSRLGEKARLQTAGLGAVGDVGSQRSDLAGIPPPRRRRARDRLGLLPRVTYDLCLAGDNRRGEASDQGTSDQRTQEPGRESEWFRTDLGFRELPWGGRRRGAAWRRNSAAAGGANRPGQK